MANLNSGAILASPSYVCGRERKLHTRARSPRWGMAWRNLASRLAGAGLPFAVFFVTWPISLRDMEGLIGFLIRLRI